MIECFLFFKGAKECIKHALCSQSRRQRHITAGNTFRQGHEVWRYTFMFTSKEFAGPTKACSYFVDDEEHIVRFCQLTNPFQIAVRHYEHACCRLYEWFHNKRCNFIPFFIKDPFKFRQGLFKGFIPIS